MISKFIQTKAVQTGETGIKSYGFFDRVKTSLSNAFGNQSGHYSPRSEEHRDSDGDIETGDVNLDMIRIVNGEHVTDL